MAKSYNRDGGELAYNNPNSLLTSGSAVVINNVVAVALVDIGNGETGTVKTHGVWRLPKVAADVFSQGERLFYDISEQAFSNGTPAAGDILNVAIATEDAAANSAETLIELNKYGGAIQA